MFKKGLILALVLAFVATLLPACAASSNEIAIGTIMPISGPVSAYGTQARDASQMAVDEINAKGGVLGKKLVLYVEDDENSPEKTVNAFNKLVTEKKIVALVGGLTSPCTLSIVGEAQKRKIVLVTPSSTNDTVTDAGDYIFRSCYNDSFQGRVMAKFAGENLSAKTAAIIFDNNNDYSKGLKDSFTAAFTAAGGTVVATESYATGDKDFAAQLTKIAAASPDVLFVPDYYNTVSLIAKQARSAGIEVPMLGADGWDEIANNAGDEVLDCYYSNHYSPDADDAEVKAFVAAFKAKYNVEPNALAALAYDATYMIADALKAAGSTDPEKFKAAMAATDKKFVTGQISFAAGTKHDPVKSAVILKLIAGDAADKPKVTYDATVNP